jgi:phosphate:Na+ symporter
LNEAARELKRLGDVTLQMLAESCHALLDKDVEAAQRVITQEDKFVDPVFKTMVDFANQLLLQEDLTPSQKKRCFQIKNLLMDIERIGDMAEDIAGYAVERMENKVVFSSQALHDMEFLWKHAHHTYDIALQAFEASNPNLARQACDLESEFDRAYWQVRQQHIERMEAGICKPEANVIFTEVLRILERISDHADNLGVSVMRSDESFTPA